ncbi:MAG: GatB/YqeY domain-containing protein [Desulfovibrionaceae bacterium]|nr:GatB/YqeY domain-containing protein [Desulfovibrionaceae bacterium]MBO4793570.1 GatB/YqeY domain-containing protein [Deltaproteobacteria bacterium]
MTMTTRVEKDFIAAYKAKDEVRVAVLRLLKSAFKNRQVELMHPLSDDEALDVIQKQSKQRRDSIEQYTAAGRKDLADREAAELEILSSYLPEPLTPEELGAAIEAAIAETGVSSMAGMGKVMSAVLAACKGRVDGKTASAAVRARLQKNG